jgi:NAD+ kinase
MSAKDTGGKSHEHRAVNEVSLLRQTAQMPRIRIAVDDAVRMEELFGDGVLLSTPAGSTGYNFSAHGPILPIGSNVLALTPINPFRPRRWPSAVLPHTARVRFDVLDPTFRPVSATADNVEVRDVTHVEIREDQSVLLTMLFDEGHALDEKVLREQFAG